MLRLFRMAGRLRVALISAAVMAGTFAGGDAVAEAGSEFAPCRLDVDGNGQVEAQTDGNLILRFLYGFTGYPLVANAIGEGATRTTAAEIADYLAGCGEMLDADANRRVDALTDGYLILRYLSGFDGEALIAETIGPNAYRTTPEAIAEALDFYQVPGPAFALAPPVQYAPLLSQVPAELWPLLRYEGSGRPGYTLLEGPEGMEIDSDTGLLSWTPPLSAEGTSQQVRIEVTDGEQVVQSRFDVRVAQPVEMATAVDGSSVRVTETGTLQGLALDLPAQVLGSDGRPLAPSEVRIARVSANDIPGIPASVIPLTDAFRVTPLNGNGDLMTIRFPTLALPPGRALPELMLYTYTAVATDTAGPLWISSQYDLDISSAGIVSIRSGALGSLSFIGAPAEQALTPSGPTGQPLMRSFGLATVVDPDVHCSAKDYAKLFPDLPEESGGPYPYPPHQECVVTDAAGVSFTIEIKNYFNSAVSMYVPIEDVARWIHDARRAATQLWLTTTGHFTVHFEEMDSQEMFSCNSSAAGFVAWENEEAKILHINNRVSDASYLRSIAAHEYMHHVQFHTAKELGKRSILAFGRLGAWIYEGTAKWFEDVLYDRDDTYKRSWSEETPMPQILGVGLASVPPTLTVWDSLMHSWPVCSRWPHQRSENPYNPYARFAFWKLLSKSCANFSLSLSDIFALDRASDPAAVLKEKIESWDCSFWYAFHGSQYGPLADALLTYQLATVKENDISILDNDESGFSFDTSVEEILIPIIGGTRSSADITVPPLGAKSLRIDSVPDVPVGMKAVVKIERNSTSQTDPLVHVYADSGMNQPLIEPVTEAAKTGWFDSGEQKEFVYYYNISEDISPSTAPGLFVTLVNPDVGDNNAVVSVEVDIVPANGDCEYSSDEDTIFDRICVRQRPEGGPLYLENLRYTGAFIHQYVLTITGVGLPAPRGRLGFEYGASVADVQYNREPYSDWRNLPCDFDVFHFEEAQIIRFDCAYVSEGYNPSGFLGWIQLTKCLDGDCSVLREWPRVFGQTSGEHGSEIKSAEHLDQCLKMLQGVQEYPELQAAPGSCAQAWNHDDENGDPQTCPYHICETLP